MGMQIRRVARSTSGIHGLLSSFVSIRQACSSIVWPSATVNRLFVILLGHEIFKFTRRSREKIPSWNFARLFGNFQGSTRASVNWERFFSFRIFAWKIFTKKLGILENFYCVRC